MYNPSVLNLAKTAKDALEGAKGILMVGWECGDLSPEEDDAESAIREAMRHLDGAIKLLEEVGDE